MKYCANFIKLWNSNRNVHVKTQLRKMAFEIDDKLFSLSANGKLAELKGLTSLSNINLNVTNKRGWTALMFAARNGHDDVVKLLMQKGVELEKTNSLGQTAYDIASFWSHDKVMTSLKSLHNMDLAQEPVHFFTVRNLDRASDKRKDRKWLSETLLRSPDARIMVFVKTFPVLQQTEKSYQTRLFRSSELKNIIDLEQTDKSEIIFLGNKTEDGRAISLFAVNLLPAQYKELASSLPSDNLQVLERIRDAFVLKADDAALAGLAHSICDWHTRCVYCESCGSRTLFSEAGYKRRCTNDSCLTVREVKNSSYPRLDPTIIAAVVSPDRSRLLLARGRKFLPNMWSCLAGFMEPGESIEDACRREVFEESGVTVGRVNYHSSQPWPFPTQLMVGLVGQALSDKIVVDKSELDDARWFSRSEVVKMMTRNHPEGYFIPPHYAIAHHLVKAFLHQTASKI